MKIGIKITVPLLALSLSSSLYSQNKTILGRVIDDLSSETMAGVVILHNDSLQVGQTDLDGNFKILIPIKAKEIKFVGVGMYPTSIELTDTCDKIEVVMMLSSSYDFITLRRAERKRKKRFEKFTEIHRQAFEKGLFETEYPCYNREFEPFYLDK